jgi:type IV secretory pathway VirB10-like protein
MIEDPAEDQPIEPAAAKIDPSSLTLRVPPPRAVRFRRGVVMAITAVAALSLITVTGWALLSRNGETIATPREEASPARVRAPAMFAEAPSSYADIPKLPDPTAAALSSGQAGDQPAGSRPLLGTQPGGDPGATAARQRAMSERTTALGSPVLAQLAQPSGPAGADRPADASTNARPELSAMAEPSKSDSSSGSGAEPDPNSQAHKLSLVDAPAQNGSINPHAMMPAPSPWLVSAGSIIPASLITAVNSDLPGQVAAQVTENIYDSPTGRILLIPQGSRLIGKTDNMVAYGQQRVLLLWQRIIWPDGTSLTIDNLPATDAAGSAGLSDSVDNHTGSLLKGIALSTLLGVGTELSFGSSDSDLVRAVRQSTEGDVDRAAQQFTAKNLNVQPTLKVRPGWPVRVVVHQDLVLRPWSPAVPSSGE